MMLRFNFTRFNQQSGFTLIELMVVLVIVGLLASLTGGMMIESVAKQERLVEVEKVNQIFQSLSYKAFYTGYNIHVVVDRNKMNIAGGDIKETVSFNQLSFQPAEYLVSTQAIISPEIFSIKWNDEFKQYDVPTLFTPLESTNVE